MKKFNMINEGFICENCGENIPKSTSTARDHCPHCLYSKHVDINPGDRLNPCKGLLVPSGIEKFRDTYKIVYVCSKCKERHRNIIDKDDNMDLIIKLSVLDK